MPESAGGAAVEQQLGIVQENPVSLINVQYGTSFQFYNDLTVELVATSFPAGAQLSLLRFEYAPMLWKDAMVGGGGLDGGVGKDDMLILGPNFEFPVELVVDGTIHTTMLVTPSDTDTLAPLLEATVDVSDITALGELTEVRIFLSTWAYGGVNGLVDFSTHTLRLFGTFEVTAVGWLYATARDTVFVPPKRTVFKRPPPPPPPPPRSDELQSTIKKYPPCERSEVTGLCKRLEIHTTPIGNAVTSGSSLVTYSDQHGNSGVLVEVVGGDSGGPEIGGNNTTTIFIKI